MLKKKSPKKSPLKGRPLRYTGQSTDEKIDSLFDDVFPLFGASILLISMAVYEWFRYYRNPPPVPKTATVIASLFLIFTLYKMRKALKQIKKYRLGRDGERAVGQSLEQLRESGCRVFHDIIGENFNIDHVIITTKGIFLIETKTISKPSGKEAPIIFDGQNIKVPGCKFDKDPIVQVTASKEWLKNLLQESTGKTYPVKPVVVFPGWFIETTPEGKRSDYWVLNPKALPKYIYNAKDQLSIEDMKLAAFHLSRFIRTT